jgi:hypothetical protein
MASHLRPSAPVSRSVNKPGDLVIWLSGPFVLFRFGLVLIFALYIRTIGFDFVYDDLLIPVSPLIRSWHGLIDAFKSDIFAAGGQAGSSYYRPVASAFGVLVAQVTPGNPGWYHLISLLLEVAVYTVTYQFGRLFFEDDRIAVLTAILFALHPTKV